jgi:2-methylcitrate dehydratase PrpD
MLRPEADMTDTASRLAQWAVRLAPSQDEIELAGRALTDTLAVTIAGLAEPVAAVVGDAPGAQRWATVAHVLDYDDLHIPSTSHISVICVPATLAAGGSATAYLGGAGVMARLGVLLGWPHYSAGWHATCTAGALGAAVCAGLSLGLDAGGLGRAMALAVPGAGGVQRAFGTMAKSLQAGFAAQAGVRAARLARAGATADTSAVDQWLALLRGGAPGPAVIDTVLAEPAAIPGSLAIKPFPCCYALQRPICALAGLGPLEEAEITGVEVRTPAAALQPLIHHRPVTGLEGKFCLVYGVAAALLDARTGFASFTDAAVARPAAQRLLRRVSVCATVPGQGGGPGSGAGGTGLLTGSFEADIVMRNGFSRRVSLAEPLGSPARPLTAAALAAKVADCCGNRADDVLAADWDTAAPLLRGSFTDLPG